MATLREIHTAIETRLKTIPGLQTRSHPPQGITPPVAFVQMSRWDTESMSRRGWKQYTFSVIVATSQSVRPQDGYQALIEYADSAGSKSIELAIWDGNDQSAGTFAGLPETDVHVAEFNVLGASAMDALELYGGEFQVTVLTKA